MYKLYIVNDRDGLGKSTIIIYSVLGLLAALFVLSLALVFSGKFIDLELKTFDYRMKSRGKVATHPNIISVDIDKKSIDHFGSLPWDLVIHAKMIEKLVLNKANTIAYNLLFHSAEHEENEFLVEATMEADNIFFPVIFDFRTSHLRTFRTIDETPLDRLNAYGFGKFVGDKKHILSAYRAMAPFYDLTEESEGLGHIYLPNDNDGIIRKVPLIVEMNEMLFPSFALITVMDYCNVTNEQMEISIGKNILLKGAHVPGEEEKRDIVIPIDDKGMMLINYTGGWSEIASQHYSFEDILKEGRFNFKDKLVIVSKAASENDAQSIPLDEHFPSGAIHGTIMNTILTGNFLKDTNSLIKIAIILLFGIIGAFSGLLPKWYVKIIAPLVIGFGYLIMNIYLFRSFGIVLEVVSPMVALFSGCTIAVLPLFFLERGDMTNSMLSEQPKINEELTEINNSLKEKDKVITASLAELSGQRLHIGHLPLKEKLRRAREEKEDLEKKKVMLLRQLSSLNIKVLRQEAKRYNIITKNLKLLDAFDCARKIGVTDHNVLIIGEAGTEKDIFTEVIHSAGSRENKDCITINCASLKAGQAEEKVFEHIKENLREGVVDIGTIILENIDSLDYEIQPKLLKLLQEGEIESPENACSFYVNLRVIASSAKNIEENAHLYKRLFTFPIMIPPLRERVDDIPYLVDFFIKKYKGEKKIIAISKEALEALHQHTWPGNVSELEKVIMNASITTQHEKIQREDIVLDPEKKVHHRKKKKKMAPV
ncbi:MAG: CHASE2 domain-containing protein [bacterium]